MLNRIRQRLAGMILGKASSGTTLTVDDLHWTSYGTDEGIYSRNIPRSPLALVNLYRSWVYVCATTNARFMSTLNLRLYVRKPRNSGRVRFLRDTAEVDDERKAYLRSQPHLRAVTGDPSDDLVEVVEHPFLDFIRRGDGELTGHECMQLTDIYQEITGNGYWFVERDERGLPERYTVLPSQYTRIVAPQGVVLGYRVGTRAQNLEFAPDEVVHFRFPSPFNLIYGYGPGQAAYGEAHYDEQQLNLERSMQDNHNIPAGLLTPALPNPLTSAQMKQFEESWDRHYGGVKNAGRMGLSPFPVKLLQFAMDPRKAEMLARRKVSREEVAAVFGLPPTMLDMSKSDASAVQGDITYQRNTILPRARLKEARLNRAIISLYDEPNLFCAYDNPVPADRQYELQRAQSMAQTSDLFFVNEIRQAFNAEPDPKRENEIYEHDPVGSFAGPSNNDGTR